MKRNLNRRDFLGLIGAGMAGAALTGCAGEVSSKVSKNGGGDINKKPNFIVILCDNLGYGDIGCFGSKKHRTPNIDRMAAEGMRFTSFYAASSVCTPSRASLMTGCYPRRVNMHQDERGRAVLFPVARKGLNPDEITIAEVLKEQGYATACIGKWHLGDQRQFLPTRQGFDYYFGVPYSDDMVERKGRWPPLPLMQNEKVIEAPANRNTLTKRYTQEVDRFITSNRDRPFFVYLPHAMPGSTDSPFASEAFRGKSANGPYGDSVEELDFSTGQILASLKKLDVDKHTLVLWTSDNGAPQHQPAQGSNAPLSGWGYTTMEGGMRVPCVVRWPGKIPAGKTCDEMASTMDLLPTFAHLAGTKVLSDRIIDGKDIWPLMSGKEGVKSPHKVFYYYQIDQLQAVRSGRWKLHLPLKMKKEGWGKGTPNTPPQLYDLDGDIGETTNVAAEHAGVVKRLLALAEKAREDLGDVKRSGRGQRPAGWVMRPKPLILSSG